MSLICKENSVDHSIRVQQFQNCMNNNPIKNIGSGEKLVLHTCCEQTDCDNPEIIDPRCQHVEKIKRPHFGDLRPEDLVKQNSKQNNYKQIGIGIL